MFKFKRTSVFRGLILLAAAAQICRFTPLHVRSDRREPSVYTCGYDLSKLANKILPEFHLTPLSKGPRPRSSDVLLVGMHAGCSADHTFPGKVVYVNGEPFSHKTRRRSYYLGPLSKDVQSMWRSNFHYVSYAALELPGALPALRNRQQSSGEKFLLYVSSRCLPHRETAFDLFSLLGVVSAGGRCHGAFTTNYEHFPVEGVWHDETTAEAYSKFKFGLVMENTDTPGYVTEKVLLAFVGGTVPIYYGSRDVFDIFNEAAFIYYTDSSKEIAIAEVQYLLKNKTAYTLKATQPILAKGALEKYFWSGETQVNHLRNSMGFGAIPRNAV